MWGNLVGHIANSSSAGRDDSTCVVRHIAVCVANNVVANFVVEELAADTCQI